MFILRFRHISKKIQPCLNLDAYTTSIYKLDLFVDNDYATKIDFILSTNA